MKSLLLEIGCEEIPARFVPKGLQILREALAGLLEKSSIGYGKISEYATPRRLALYIEGVSESQKDRITETLGPPKKAAFGNDGAPTKAALGFARSLNMNVSDLRVVKTERGEYMAATVEEKGKRAVEVLSGAMPGLISSLQLPKSMRWGNGTLRFFRPVKWILALFGDEVIAFELDGIKSGRVTYGHRFLSPQEVVIKDPSDYPELLLKRRVIAGIPARKEFIAEGIGKAGAANNCIAHEDDELLDTVTNLVEYPAVVTARFDNKFITLPKELLITVMRTHQKYFSTEDKDGNILPFFIVVSNTKPENGETVRKGAERVLRARLEDARFYYIEDQKIPLAGYVEKLKNVTFQDKLGTLHDKVERIRSLSSYLAEKMACQAEEKLQRASMLCKADLVTGVVREFPELQGYMGMIYAENSGEDKETATAIFEHYRPKFAGDALPGGDAGTIISLSDKMDNIVSFFSLGLIPSGSEDPYALRRQAAGIINILQNGDYTFALDEFIYRAMHILGVPSEETGTLSGKIMQFFNQRLEGMLLSQGYGYDLVNAVLSTGNLNMKELKLRIDALSDLKKDTAFPGLLTAAKRVYNILVKAQPGPVDEKLLTDPSEKNLFLALAKIRDDVMDKNFRALFDLESPINTFFDSVLVMDKDDSIKNNRIALLFSIKNVFNSLGDFSKIVE
jgi:glycyl-tRNA synthetase beta chain